MAQDDGRQGSPALTIVVVTHNSEAVVAGLLDSLPAALSGVSAEVIVVDNASTDNTVGVVEAYGGCTVIRSANDGYAAGVNNGIRAGVGQAVLVLNADVRLHPGSVSPLVKALEHESIGIVAPRILDADGHLFASLRREPTLLRAVGLNFTGLPRFAEYVRRDTEYDAPAVVDWALGAVLLISRHCLDVVGEWDESFFLYSEETDFCLRARDLGIFTRYEPGSIVLHIGGQSGQSPETHAMQIVNRVRLYRRRHGALSSWTFFALTVISEMSWVARGHTNSRRSVEAMLRPGRRPSQLGCSGSLMP